MCSSRRAAGMTLIEVVVFIVVLGIGIAATVMLFNQVTKASVDPMIRKQAIALASSLLEEIELKPFTYCDPDDPAVYTAGSTGACATAEGIGVEGGETRYNAASRFDNVSDYNGFAMGSGQTDPNVRTADNTAIAALSSYSVTVTVAAIAANELGATIPTATTEALRITVVATHVPTGTSVSLQGYRTLYAPNSP
jgi:MSHA pilin protein MshD